MKLLFALSTVLIIVACGPLPRPFIDEEPQNNPLLQLTGTRPIAVEPPILSIPITQDKSSDLVLWTQDALSANIREQGLPAAHYAPAENSLHVYSSFTSLAKKAETTDLKLDIVVTETSLPNKVIITFSEQTTVPTDLLTSSPKILLDELIHRASKKLTKKIIALDTTEPEIPLTNPVLLLTLEPFPDILTKPAQRVLKNELKTSLQLRGYKLIEGQDSVSQYSLKLEVRPVQTDNNFFLTLSWVVLDYKTGEEVGVIEQTNSVPNIPLSRIIMPVSEAIAEGAAIGIEDLLQQKSHQNQTVLK
ncbi:MAG: hypothetical protein V7776_04620 [Halopseudomonas aestusnigri]